MKRQLIILATAFTPIAFFSCTKENTEMKSANYTASIETTGDAQLTNRATLSPNPFKTGVTGWFEFNGNLKDKAGLLGDAVTTPGANASFTTDRKGVANQAIRFSGRYGLDIAKVPLQPNMSVAAWVKYNFVPTTNQTYYFVSSAVGPNFAQQFDKFWGVIATPLTDGVVSAPLNSDWHHLVATYDGNELKFYVDGVFTGTSTNPSQIPPQVLDYHVGYYGGISNVYWQGAIDELTFFCKTLTADEVGKLWKM